MLVDLEQCCNLSAPVHQCDQLHNSSLTIDWRPFGQNDILICRDSQQILQNVEESSYMHIVHTCHFRSGYYLKCDIIRLMESMPLIKLQKFQTCTVSFFILLLDLHERQVSHGKEERVTFFTPTAFESDVRLFSLFILINIKSNLIFDDEFRYG